jgi:putative transposase
MNEDAFGGASFASPNLGGRSSATPRRERTQYDPPVQHAPGSQSSPLQGLKPRRLRRKAPAHFPPIESGFTSAIIYLTVCVNRRRPLLANDKAAGLIVEAWEAATIWSVGRYVIMPNHIHPFCAPNIFPTRSLKKWIERWKNHITREWTNLWQVPIWQREFWDRQLRRLESYDEKWEYVRNNPVRHGYVAWPEDWPYQGELNVLGWHDR